MANQTNGEARTAREALTLTIRYPCCHNTRRIHIRHSRFLIGDHGLTVPPGLSEVCSACNTCFRPGRLLPYADIPIKPLRPRPRPIRPIYANKKEVVV